MLEKQRASRSMFTHASGPPRGMSSTANWIRFLAAVLLALVIGSVGQMPPAQAAPASDALKWYMDVPSPKTKICVGDTVEYMARVYYVFQTTPREEFPIPGVKIEATSSNKNVGSFKNETAVAGFGNDDLVTASFLFTAKNPGATNLFFEGFVDSKFRETYVSFTVPVTVIHCKYKVTSRSYWTQKTANGTVVLNTFMIGVRMTGDEQGHFTVAGSSRVSWVMTTFIPGYGSMNTIQFSQADLDGQLYENNQFVLKHSLNATSGSETNCGAAGCGGGAVILVPDSLKLIFPAEGGTRRASHGLKSPGGQLTGWSVVTVKVEKP